ncbi:MAG TPA: glucokinase [Bryobacteraceae bacterium]|nr:glucokinase [Bryobacteraceae bacterium]
MILAGDIGGTNTRLAFFDGPPDRLRPIEIEIFPSGHYSGPAEIVRKFLGIHKHPAAAAAFGLPGAVVNGRVETTNLPWVVDAREMAAELGLPQVQLINDLYANAHGITLLEESDFVVLNPGVPQASGNRALISAGTGLGEAGLYADAHGTYHPFPSEGGHADFGPRNELEMELLRYLAGRFEHVSYERVLSGPGLHNLYEFLRDTGRGQEPPWLAEQIAQGDASAAISKSAIEGTSEICVQALDMFVSLYGAEAGNLALKMLATGGMYVGGGIAPKIIRKLSSTAFMKSFTAKGRLGSVLKEIPVRVITNDKAALLGAGRVAALSAATAPQASGTV